ncbi:MAG TPA: putative baseplate assembly protein, partial [Actinomycetota bacterium]|nr:putative baseplate assembly protein [Actinomycetota bacterium]
PGQDEHPQTFETVEEIEARAEWNAMRVRSRAPQAISRGQLTLHLRGVNTRLQPGDGLLFVGREREDNRGSEIWEFRRLQTVDEVSSDDPSDLGRTVVTWETPLGMDEQRPIGPPVEDPGVYAFRLEGSLFGHNAPDWRTMAVSVKQAYKAGVDPAEPSTWGRQWPGFEIGRGRNATIDVDQAHPEVLPGSWVVLERPGYIELYRVVRASVGARSDFGVSGKITRIEPDIREHLSWFGLRATVVHAVSEELELAEVPVTAPLGGPWIELVPAVAGIEEGRPLVVTGRAPGAAKDEEAASEVALVSVVDEQPASTLVKLTMPLQREYDPATVTVSANVASSTHGETVPDEVLGSGAATVPFQRFALTKRPLTYVRAATASGSQPTLVLRVDGVEWSGERSLYGLGATSRSYAIRNDDQARTAVLFGDGRSGARLPTGQENVRATYRFGLGPDGNVRAGSLTLMQTRPLGIRGVTNPVEASGGTAGEALDEARSNAPLTVLTMDRIVSLQDYEDFARAFVGIAKAQASSIWDGRRSIVHLTVAAPGGAAVDPTSKLAQSLRAAVDAGRDPIEEVRIGSYRPLEFRTSAKVLIDPAYGPDDVLGRVRITVDDAFSFDRRAFGQSVTAAEVITVIQGVAGVVATDLDLLFIVDPVSAGPAVEGLDEVLGADRAHLDGTEILAAQLLLVDGSAITLEEMTP